MTPIDRSAFYPKINEVLAVPNAPVSGLSQLADLEGWDSLAIMSFIAMADTDYQVSLSAKAITQCASVDDLAALVEQSQQS